KTGVSFDGIGDTIRSFIRLLLGGLDQVAEWGEEFSQYFQDAADTVVGIFKWLWEQIQNLLGPIKGAFDFASGTLDKAKGAVSGGVDTVKGAVSGGLDTFKEWLGMGDNTPDLNAANESLY